MRNIQPISISLFIILFTGCVGVSKFTYNGQKNLENEYISFIPSQDWYTYEKQPWRISQSGKRAQRLSLHNNNLKGVTYEIEVETTPYVDGLYNQKFFVKGTKYYQVLRDEDMELDDNDREQGIGYYREWVSYIGGIKCSEGVFSRSQGGIMKDISNKNYGISCGYYDKVEGKRIFGISYRYLYSGGSLRHQKDVDVPQSNLVSFEQAKLGIKQAVKDLISSIKIKSLDRERMEREGLMHYDKKYEISEF